MIVREGQVWRKISDVKNYHNLSLVECDIDYQVVLKIDGIVKIKRIKDESFYNYDLDKFEDDFIFIFTPDEEEDKPKIKIGDVVRIKKDPAYIEVMGYNEVLNVWYGKYYGTSLSGPFIDFDIKDVISVLDGAAKEDKPKNKYHRDLKGVTVDVYDVLKAFEVTDPALQHLIKKALCAGLRGHKNKDQDLQDILDSAKRAVELNK